MLTLSRHPVGLRCRVREGVHPRDWLRRRFQRRRVLDRSAVRGHSATLCLLAQPAQQSNPAVACLHVMMNQHTCERKAFRAAATAIHMSCPDTPGGIAGGATMDWSMTRMAHARRWWIGSRAARVCPPPSTSPPRASCRQVADLHDSWLPLPGHNIVAAWSKVPSTACPLYCS